MEKKTIDVSVKTCHYLVFILAGKQFALPLESVRRVVHAAAVTLIPKAPEIVCGLVNYKGQILPVINISRRFHLPEHEIEPGHHFIIVQTKTRHFGLVADTVTGVIEEPVENVVQPQDIISGVEFLAGVMKLEDGIMLIPDLDKLLTHEEETALKAAVHKKDKDKGEGKGNKKDDDR
jgi:purine-binding chemotaxis protein CheW